ncbi:hypothetical protein ACFY84_31725 [Streptomyces sp. NPDC012438]|uniref:hypothetical protein n=1 Tax=Streptomyces sp. NPDC012438 TaxID=3364833 RepID=UPI0036E7A2AC
MERGRPTAVGTNLFRVGRVPIPSDRHGPDRDPGGQTGALLLLDEAPSVLPRDGVVETQAGASSSTQPSKETDIPVTTRSLPGESACAA